MNVLERRKFYEVKCKFEWNGGFIVKIVKKIEKVIKM